MQKWRLAAALIALAALLAACGRWMDGRPNQEIVEIQIDKAKVQVEGPPPAQVTVHVQGVIGDSCHTLDQITQSREGNRVEVRITAIRQLGVPCMELAKLFDQVIPLEGTFEAGTYTLQVNDLETTFEVK